MVQRPSYAQLLPVGVMFTVFLAITLCSATLAFFVAVRSTTRKWLPHVVSIVWLLLCAFMFLVLTVPASLGNRSFDPNTLLEQSLLIATVISLIAIHLVALVFQTISQFVWGEDDD